MQTSDRTEKDLVASGIYVVEASAGSGKTFALAKRYVQLVLSLLYSQPSRNASMVLPQILAMTFTNKAAFEMKARIILFLKSLAIGRMPENQKRAILEPLNIPEDQVKVLSVQILETILRHYNLFMVQTIDKFINSLLSGCALKLGLTARFKIKTDSRQACQYCLDKLINDAQASISQTTVRSERMSAHKSKTSDEG